jgi:uncharacterized protein (UPF0276 family)
MASPSGWAESGPFRAAGGAGLAGLAPALEPPVCGVGLTYTPGVEAFLSGDGGRRVGALVVDCRTLAERREWEAADGIDRLRLERLRDLPGRKVLCGLGAPAGQGTPGRGARLPELERMIDRLAPAWVSEELAFDRAGTLQGEFPTLVRLPVRQSLAGLSAAVRAVRSLGDRLSVPFAVKNVASYLRPRPDEMSDGAFLAGVVETAGCGLVIDVSSLWTSARHGRQAQDALVAELPLHRVWELRVGREGVPPAGRPDARTGGVPDEILGFVRRLVPRLPALRALVLEVGPRSALLLGADGLRREIERLHALWDERSVPPAPALSPPALGDDLLAPDGAGAEEWEDTLGALVVGREARGRLAEELGGDPGLEVYRLVAAERRQAAASSLLPFAVRLLVLALGKREVARLLEGFWRREPLRSARPRDARRLAAFLAEEARGVERLRAVAAYDAAVLDALATGARAVIAVDEDPRPVFASLAANRLPPPPAPNTIPHEVEVWPDGVAVRPRVRA